MDTVQALNLILALVILLILVLAGVALIIIFRIRQKRENDNIQQNMQVNNKTNAQLITRDGKTIDSIYKFMEFDRIVDNMIVRKNYKQYVMVLDCKGVNYDLLSEDEKNAVEAGFVELLNTLRFPIQLYIQTRTLNLTDILEDYRTRTDDLKEQIGKISAQMQTAQRNGDRETLARLQFDRQRKENILEYGESIEEYTQRISDSRNILQQKTYVIVSYYANEYGDISKYSRDELNEIIFSELYTRCQTVIRALTSAEVTARVLSSEELAELLYVAYNRDESETLRLKNALNAEYDRLYSTARDIMDEKKKRIEVQIENAAAQVAAKSIIRADAISRQEKERRIKARAKQMVDEYKNELSTPLYNETQNQIANADVEEMLNEDEPQRRVMRKNNN